MREILFRGKRISNGEWVEGSLLVWPDGDAEICHTKPDVVHEMLKALVRPKTVGQFTGLTDKNGKKIFEGDIVRAVYKANYIGASDTDFGIGIIEYCDSYYGGAAYQINIIGEAGSRVFSSNVEIKVIGNIHDNPELLGGEG